MILTQICSKRHIPRQQLYWNGYGQKGILRPLKTPFSFAWFGRSVIHHPDVKNADIIHLHWVNHGFLNPKHMAEIAKLNKPVVWTFHDSNAFTGGCHVRYTCDHFKQECGNCPLLKRFVAQ